VDYSTDLRPISCSTDPLAGTDGQFARQASSSLKSKLLDGLASK